MPTSRSKTSREKVRAHRKRLREQGLRPLQIWVPDVNAPSFRRQAHRQSSVVARSTHAESDQTLIDAITESEVRRGETWTAAGGGSYAGKPRPVVIVQDDSFDATASITVCAFTTDPTDAPLLWVLIAPNERNGLAMTCRLMVDKITTVPKSRLRYRIGRLDAEDLVRLNWAMLVFLGLATPRSASV